MLDLNESPIIYTMPCVKTHQTLEDLEGLEGLEDLVDLVDPEDQEYVKDPLQQYLQQHQQQETLMTRSWEIFHKYSTERGDMPGPSLTTCWDTFKQTLESQASIHQFKKYPSRSPSYKDHK
jgi:hypothetical protein